MKHSCRPCHGTARPHLLLLSILLLPIACAQSTSHRLDDALQEYDAGHYDAALEHAQAARFSGSADDRAEASYVAGLAAAKLNHTATARHLLESAAAAGNRTLAGKANASLGTVLLEDGEPLEAARAFDRAADQLTGEEATHAIFLAGVAYRDAGHAEQARRRFATASEDSSTKHSERAGLEIANTGFSIQAGAYSNRDNAVARAQEVSAAARGKGLPPARIVKATRADRMLNIVQVGSFSTRSDAEFARRQLGVTGTRVERVAVADAQGP